MYMDYKLEIAKLIIIDDISLDEIIGMVTPARDTAIADWAFPCFKFAKALRKAPAIIANDIVAVITKPDFIASIEAVNGYVNFKLSKHNYVKGVVDKALDMSARYGDSDIGEGKTICIDYSSVNIAKPFHMGHLSATVIGASLYRIYKKLGFDVVGINHLGDWGTQFGKLIVAYKMWGDMDDVNARGMIALLDVYVKFHKEAEEKPELNDEARAWFKKIEGGDKEAMELFLWFKEVTLKDVAKIYDRLHVTFDSYKGESFYHDKTQPVLDELEAKGLSKISQGATIIEFPDDEMTPFLVKRSDGATLYSTRDIAAAFYRKDTYNFYKSLYVVAYQQNLHFKQLFRVFDMLGYDWAGDMVHVAFGMVSIDGGKLSSRGGNVVFVEDVLDTAKARALDVINEKNPNLENKDDVAEMIGTGAVVFGVLSGNRIKDISFSYDKVLNFDGETGPYVQYTYARCNSLIEKIGAVGTEIDYSTLEKTEAYELIKLIDRYPDVVADSGVKYEPSLVTRYLLAIAGQFNKFYIEQNISNSPEGEKNARLTVVNIVRDIIGGGMSLLGIQCPNKM